MVLLMRILLIFISIIILASCARLHHVQFGDMDFSEGKFRPFEIMLSETGVSVRDIAAIAKIPVRRNKRASRAAEIIHFVILLTQTGPKTGNLVFSDKYADIIAEEILRKCPSGDITGLVAIRESRRYPVISGEIVKIKGYCREEKNIGERNDS